jgi:hypothetical protein
MSELKLRPLRSFLRPQEASCIRPLPGIDTRSALAPLKLRRQAFSPNELARRAEARRLHSHDTRESWHAKFMTCENHDARESWHAKFWVERTVAAYSVRRAFMGWMEAARLAGIRAATNEQAARAHAARASANGSHEGTP